MDFWQDQPLVADRLESVHERMSSLLPDSGRFAPVLADLVATRGKMLRPALLILCAGLDHRRAEADALGAALEFLHLASLVHDDIIDEAAQRRGRPSVVSRWGTAMALYTGDYLIYLAARSLVGLDPGSVPRGSLDFMSHLLEAEAEQLEHRFSLVLDQTAYLQRIEAKTGLLFSLATGLGTALATGEADAAKAMERAGLDFGIAFQLRDDLEDLADPTLPDLREGNYTLPVLLALKVDPGIQAHLEKLAAQSLDDPAALLERIRSTDAIPATRRLMRDRAAAALTVFAQYLGSRENDIIQWLTSQLYGGAHES